MSLFESIVLGLVQGLAEFLPISSSGHLAALQHFFGISSDNVLTFTVMLHFGTLVAVFAVYWNDIVALVKELGMVVRDIFVEHRLDVNKNETRRLGVMIIIATIPTAMIGLLLNDFFESMYTKMGVIGVGLLVTGTCLYLAEKKGGGTKGVREMSFWNAFFVGVCQSVAIMPGISRSGSTMVGSLACKCERAYAVRFAFLISIPSVLGAFILELPDAVHAAADGTGCNIGVMLAGIIVSAVSGYAAIKIMIRAVTKQKLFLFSIYTWIAGVGLLLYEALA